MVQLDQNGCAPDSDFWMDENAYTLSLEIFPNEVDLSLRFSAGGGEGRITISNS